MAALAHLTQALRRSIAAHHKCRDRPVDLAEFCNRCDTGLLVREMIIRNDEIGPLIAADTLHLRQGSFGRCGGHDAAGRAAGPAPRQTRLRPDWLPEEPVP